MKRERNFELTIVKDMRKRIYVAFVGLYMFMNAQQNYLLIVVNFLINEMVKTKNGNN